MSLVNINHQRFERNLHGRDIVVCNIHGEFKMLEAALDEIDFDESRNRL